MPSLNSKGLASMPPQELAPKPMQPKAVGTGQFLVKDLSECPESGTVKDLLDWCIPTFHTDSQLPADQTGGETGQHARSPDRASTSPVIRRSSRTKKGTTRKYEDFVP